MFTSGCDCSSVSITCRPWSRAKSPDWEATISKRSSAAMASSKPFLRSFAGDDPVVPSSSTMIPFSPSKFSITHSATRPPWSTKSEPRKAT